MTLPAGYVEVASGGTRAFALTGAAEWGAAVLGSGATLHAWAAARTDAPSLTGRAPIYSVPAAASGPDERARWAVRHYVRGGALAGVLVDRYVALGPRRPWAELRASCEARARGVPTPAVVAGAVYAAGPFYRADLVTELVPDARTLADVVFAGDGPHGPAALRALGAAGRLVRALEDARVVHADLNATNVLVVGGPEGPRAHVVDLDRCAVLPADAPHPGDVMRRRLVRSLAKLARRAGVDAGPGTWSVLGEHEGGP